MEGLRAWPFLHEARNRGISIDHLVDCRKCKKMFSTETRQGMGCGWESPNPKIPVTPWTPSSLVNNAGWQCISETHSEPTVCPGYSISLPETIEIARAYTHWASGGGLRDFVDDHVTNVLRLGVEIFSGAINECQRWAMENPKSS